MKNLIISLFFLLSFPLESISFSEVEEFLLPEDHPAKKKLDEICSVGRPFFDIQTMVAAGFKKTKPQHHTQIIVTRHPELAGYVIKAYLDTQEYHQERPEHYYWLKRIRGARLIQNYLETHRLTKIFKVPKKWIYLLPETISPPSPFPKKIFILVEEDMEIVKTSVNLSLWKSDKVTKKLLNQLYDILTDLGLFDCAKPSNCCFSLDGKLAFVDTQSFDRYPVKYSKLTKSLSPSMQMHWKMIQNKKR